MSFRFGRNSRRQLSTADGRLQDIAHIVLKIKDHAVIKGHRNQREQHTAFIEGHSELDWPNGKHNKLPSIAIDVQTYPLPQNEQELREEQLYLLGLYAGVGYMKDIPIRIGGDWDRDGEITDNSFDDFFHVEIDDGD